ncbi:hypothetical protein HDV05_000339 [Chytridiales sp. JEL 0842]|nr:hypothetical protein HDV05_000339 [Chytridiales sp. JEL 0842]
MTMPGWYDIMTLDRNDEHMDEKGMLKTVDIISKMVKDEIASGIPSKRIVLGGFSQGAATSLLTSMVSDIKFGGIVAMSGYLPLAKRLPEIGKDTNQWTKYFLAHGDSDEVVEYQWGKMSADKLKEMGRDVVFKTYKWMGHSANDQELRDLERFLQEDQPKPTKPTMTFGYLPRKIPLEIYPILVLMSGALALGAYIGTRKLMYDPDIRGLRKKGTVDEEHWKHKLEVQGRI